MNGLTLIAIAILAISALAGMKAGLIKTVFSMFSVIIALILTIWISPVVSNMMQKSDKIVEYFNEKVELILGLEDITVKSAEQESFIDELPLPDSFKKTLLENNSTKIYEALNVNSFAAYVTRAVTNVIINAVAFIGTFLVLIIILQVLCIVLNIISKLPVLNSVNRAGGLIAGLIHGLLALWIACILITAAGGTDWGRSALAAINDSSLLTFLYDNNLITKYVTDLRIK